VTELVIGVASLVAAISFVLFPLALVAGLVGLVIGIVALARRQQSGATNKGQAIAGVVCSILASPSRSISASSSEPGQRATPASSPGSTTVSSNPEPAPTSPNASPTWPTTYARSRNTVLGPEWQMPTTTPGGGGAATPQNDPICWPQRVVSKIPTGRAEQADQSRPLLCAQPHSVTVVAVSRRFHGPPTVRSFVLTSLRAPPGPWFRADRDRSHERRRAVDKERGR
jgi:Domain of unknown function (DUF4190)